MSKRFSVPHWNTPALQAASMNCGACTETIGLVGIDMIAQDGTTFAHGHFDVRTAAKFHQELGETIQRVAAQVNQ